MPGRKNRRPPAPKGQGAAAAKQMGLFTDFNPEEMMMDMDGNLDDPDLEAEFAAIVGGSKAAAAGGRSKPKGKSTAPLPMEDIEKMAEECMRDSYEDDDEDLENDEDLLAELQEVVGEEEVEDEGKESPTSPTPPASTATSLAETPESSQQEVKVTATPGSLQHTLEERISMYKTAIANAKAAGESSKARRYERGLKTLETMLASVKKGRKIEEESIPPPVASGAPSASPAAGAPEPAPPEQAGEAPEEMQAVSPETGPSSVASSTLASPELSCATSPAEENSPQETAESHTESTASQQQATKEMLLGRQREYKLAALKAKQQGDLEAAKLLIRTSKKFEALLEALENGQPVDLSNMPPPPGVVEAQETTSSPSPAKEPAPRQAADPAPPASVAPAAPPQPKDVLEALEQRMAKYQEACAQAKAAGDDRKARMHERIAKQYQSAIRAHKAGRPVHYEELPVPPGFPPIPGQADPGAEQGFAAVLDAATKLVSDEAQEAEEGEEEEAEETKPPAAQTPKKPMLAVPPTVQGRQKSPSPSLERLAQKEGLSPTAQQQVNFLEGRKKQYMKAALLAKQKNNMEQAKGFLRAAKGFDPMIEAAKSGKAVDISKVPSPPGDEDDDFIMVHHSDVQLSEKAEEVYAQLAKLLKEQYEKSMMYSKQFTHLGNITETTKFEKMAERCKKNLEILKLSQARGLDPPKHHFEERTYKTVRIFPELSSTEMVVVIVKGMNLPAPHGIATNDLDAYVKFEFPYPSTDQPQKLKTNVIKNTNCPEYNQSFTLNINRNHRGFRRIIQSKGLKLEVLHKGGFLRSDKPVGTAHLKLEKLETESEVREIVEVIDGRKPTGGRVEVRVRLREPLSAQDLQTISERWVVLEQPQVVL